MSRGDESETGRRTRRGNIRGSELVAGGGRWGDWEGRLSSSTQAAELAALRRFYRWARSEGLRPDDASEGIRPPRREPYARARGLNAEEVARLLAVIPGDSVVAPIIASAHC